MIRSFSLFVFVVFFFYANNSHGLGSDLLSRKYDVLGIGSAQIDLLINVTDEQIKKDLSIPYGVNKGDLLVVDNQTFFALKKNYSDYSVSIGGDVANIISDMISLGGRASINSVISNDEFGLLFHKNMLDYGVESINLPENNVSNTILRLVFISKDGERTIISSKPQTEFLRQKHIKFHSIKNYKLLITEASLLDGEDGNSTKVINRALNSAEKVGTIRVMHLNDKLFVSKFKDEILGNNDDIEIILGNEEEALTLFNTKNFVEAENKCRKTFKICVFTRGDKGAVVVSGNETYRVASLINTKEVIDSSGSGAGFAAGFLYAYINGTSLEESARQGSRVAAYISKQLGSRPETKLSDIE